MSATFVLVHGAWHGGWCYARVADRLHALGHRVYTPTLTGLGERSHLYSDAIDLSTHITDVLNVLEWEELDDVILCGHSYGGFVVGGVAENVPERLAGLVFLDAFVPENGQSMHDAVGPAMRDRQLAGVTDNGVPPIPAHHFHVNEDDAAWVDAQCVPQPLATFTEKLVLTGAIDRVPKRAYIRAANYPNPNFDRYKAKFAADPGWVTYDVPSGHDVMLDRPDDLTALLIAEAERIPGARALR